MAKIFSTPALDSLKAASSLHDLAPLLGLKPAVLAMQLYKKDKRTGWYTSFEIKKKYGGVRSINAPEKHLKLIQSRLSKILQDCLLEIALIKNHKESPDRQGIAHGFKRYHSIMTNGRPHINRRFVFNTDLQDFFGAINFGRVRAFFEKNKNFSLDPKVSEILAHIICHKGSIPQGSPCSPVVSNLIAHSMDTLLAKAAKKNGVTYTRYADDLTFSTNKKEFPLAIAKKITSNEWVPGKEVSVIVEKSGFFFNEKKTRMQYKDSRQEVTGLSVNKKVNVTSDYRYTTRAMVSSLFKTGKFKFCFKAKNLAGEKEVVQEFEGRPAQLLGRLTHIDYVDQFNESLRKKNGLPPALPEGRLKLFRNFLYYYHFYMPEQPVILCEGKTDNIYIKCALKAHANAFPSMVKPGSPPELKVRLFKYSERRTGIVTDLSGGVGGICKLLKNFHANLSMWESAPQPTHPVIVVIDNDSGADNIYQAIAGITKKPKPKGYAKFIHVTQNIYVVPTPPVKGKKNTDIECLFSDATLKEELNGKKFNKSKEIEDSSEYGKTAFAINVVAKKAHEINFAGFTPLLQRIKEAMDHYYKSIK
ncbi:Reverse transcriptase (RNA-dependent DNA polymerase) [Xanthomonas bromi]|uniref:RNA-directed DNA polymerase n=1 Tax=Xanthomonas bromi TaxID=56449 RepID=A0A1C3NRR6_9XANT|nr:retron Ec67 family RNA-directed DNA polymerase/endonuclease [Xanthomonas bromi]PPV04926.1 RNA-directed DNA polymerase [Xanthomonas bromi]SBV53090.1 Reverse transcriptase (RNA-dependent DNA polymerase) [Xanthomonas bromi]